MTTTAKTASAADRCPKCGGELMQGYGLAGGGIGCYTACVEDGCDYFDKVQDEPEDCLCVHACEGATRESMEAPGPQHDRRCWKYRAPAPQPEKKEGTPGAQPQIKEGATRVAPLVGRKCRASHAKVIALSQGETATSWLNPPEGANRITCRVGEVVRAHQYDPSPFVECSGGIHFFISRREAEEYE